MDAIAYINLIFRLGFWLLLTGDFSWLNIGIGLIIALLLPRSYTSPGQLKDWLSLLWKIIIAIPQAFIEAIEIMLFPHNFETIVREKVKPRRRSGLVFLDIFLITFTPKTIVVKYDKKGWYEVHEVVRKKKEHGKHGRHGKK